MLFLSSDTKDVASYLAEKVMSLTKDFQGIKHHLTIKKRAESGEILWLLIFALSDSRLACGGECCIGSDHTVFSAFCDGIRGKIVSGVSLLP